MKENNEENLNEISELDENVEMVELGENEENDVEGGASAWGPDKGYSTFHLGVGNIAIYHPEAYMKISGTAVPANTYRVINGWGFKWVWTETGHIKLICSSGNSGVYTGLQFWGKPQGKNFKKETASGCIYLKNGTIQLDWSIKR